MILFSDEERRGKPTLMLRSLCVALLLTVPAVLTGCKQGDGERCQVQSDCQDTLICVLPPGGSPQTGGVCRDANGGQDLSTELDMATNADLSSSADLSTHD